MESPGIGSIEFPSSGESPDGVPPVTLAFGVGGFGLGSFGLLFVLLWKRRGGGPAPIETPAEALGLDPSVRPTVQDGGVRVEDAPDEGVTATVEDTADGDPRNAED